MKTEKKELLKKFKLLIDDLMDNYEGVYRLIGRNIGFRSVSTLEQRNNYRKYIKILKQQIITWFLYFRD